MSMYSMCVSFSVLGWPAKQRLLCAYGSLYISRRIRLVYSVRPVLGLPSQRLLNILIQKRTLLDLIIYNRIKRRHLPLILGIRFNIHDRCWSNLIGCKSPELWTFNILFLLEFMQPSLLLFQFLTDMMQD